MKITSLFVSITMLILFLAINVNAVSVKKIKFNYINPALDTNQIEEVIVVMEEEVSGVGCQSSGKSNIPLTPFKGGIIQEMRKLIPDMSTKRAALSTKPSRAAKNLQNMYIAKIEKGKNISDVIKNLNAMPEVKYAEPNYPIELFAAPNDTHLNYEWFLNNTGQTYQTDFGTFTNGTTGADVGWLAAYESGALPSNQIIIAVTDTGTDYTHEDITNRMWRIPDEIINGIDDDFNGYVDDIYGIDIANGDGNPMDDNGHGTHVSGTIAAETDNGIGVAGICPNARIMAVKIFDYSGRGNSANGIVGIYYAANMGAKIINCSWGGNAPNEAMNDAIVYANELGCVVV